MKHFEVTFDNAKVLISVSSDVITNAGDCSDDEVNEVAEEWQLAVSNLGGKLVTCLNGTSGTRPLGAQISRCLVFLEDLEHVASPLVERHEITSGDDKISEAN